MRLPGAKLLEYIEVDFWKPLLPLVFVMVNKQVGEYEGLYMSCFSCGEYIHRGVRFPKIVPMVEPELEKRPTGTAEGGVQGDAHGTSTQTLTKFDSWIISKKLARRVTVHSNKPALVVDQASDGVKLKHRVTADSRTTPATEIKPRKGKFTQECRVAASMQKQSAN